ncbi:RmlC-like cupin domain-containing protein [Phialemonium atrogriseum]|uniref:RmlC-like cupin domain-containing protein n=1 Tax=Phialemonium atrogriseum TaxID=1093897 RepID=A0AAJ0FC03_9PEZI|nr:RmlC-like cupin domain-containing protein [Phialemonium atrogriseum]KAK1761637.1 RmlC-like cupin domain-containing protein [Phialemonium atrogriseum]
MPSTIIRRFANAGTTSSKGTETFTGDVWVDPVHNTPDTKINNVLFSPGARSHWHTHEHGQLLRVVAGSGWICDQGSQPRRLVAGDIVWAEAGTTHWHGGDDGSFMCHLAVSHGATTWHGQVTDDEYAKKTSAAASS